MNNWNQTVENIDGVGSSTKEALIKLGVRTIRDLLFNFPNRYLDTSKVSLIKHVKINEVATVVGEVIKISKKVFSRRKNLVEITISDDTGYISAIFFNQPFMEKSFNEGEKVALAGKIEYRYSRLQISSPLFDKLEKKGPVNTMGILPFHPTTAKISTKKMRMMTKNAILYIPENETLPQSLVGSRGLLSFKEALINIHFPADEKFLRAAKARLIFQEFFELQLAVILKKEAFEKNKTFSLNKDSLILKSLKELSFKLTGDQEKALKEILDDLKLSMPMNRLLQGEVGSGKTIVSFLCSLPAIEHGYQACIMAPTEILARQHFEKLSVQASKLNIKTALLTSSVTEKEKEIIAKQIKNGEIDLAIGTHSLIQKDISFKNLAFIVVDEQHRFGVEQRKVLGDKGIKPHTLVMTATPIPRSLALTLYGDLDVSTIKELPSGKDFSEKVKTLVCGPGKRAQAYEKIRRIVSEGQQAYIVCPLIDASDKMEARAVEEEIAHLKGDVFNDLNIEAIHSKIKNDEKERIMSQFSAGEIDVLVATTLVEVGVDVSNATIMVIENADRFGLAQLHQLRGRVGRGKHDALCILFAGLETEDSIKRMKAIRELKDGFSLAEADLGIRGEGQIFGSKQSGLPDLKIASLIKDYDVLLEARKEAKNIIRFDPGLKSNKALKKEVEEKYKKLLEISGG